MGHEHIPSAFSKFSLLSGQQGMGQEKKVNSGYFTF